ncbi:MAG: hypothetical protein PHH26_05010 [Candidatus Thermoplasmatota archaeon]|nr:hypothetical protein [Candidatus Thermoplasmatota archaeon]
MRIGLLAAFLMVGLMLGAMFSGCTGSENGSEAAQSEDGAGTTEAGESQTASNGGNASGIVQAENVIFSDNFNGSAMNAAWKTADCDNEDGTKFEIKEGMMQVYAGGVDVYDGTEGYGGQIPASVKIQDYCLPMADEYGAAYITANGNFEICVKVNSIDAAGACSKGGIMVKNDISKAAAKGQGYVILCAQNPSAGANACLLWDSNDDGYIDSNAKTSTVALPMWLKLVKSGTEFKGYYSTDGAKWSDVASATLSSTGQSENVGLFYCANSCTDNTIFWQANHQMGFSKFSDFVVQKL